MAGRAAPRSRAWIPSRRSFRSTRPSSSRTRLVLHPESSWLQWLAELGADARCCSRPSRCALRRRSSAGELSRERSFFLRAGGFAAAAALLAHSVYRCARRTAGAPPASPSRRSPWPARCASPGRRVLEPRQTALVPLAIAAFWMLPFCLGCAALVADRAGPRLISRQAVPPGVPLSELEASLRSFPLNAELHQGSAFACCGTTDARHRRCGSGISRSPRGSRPVRGISRRRRRAPCSGSRRGWRCPTGSRPSHASGAHRDDVFCARGRRPALRPRRARRGDSYAEAHPHLLLAYARVRARGAGRLLLRALVEGARLDRDDFERR